MKAPKDFLLNQLYHQPAWGKKYQEMAKRLPDQVELTEDFARQHALEFTWVDAIRLLLEGEHQSRAFAQEVEAARVLHEALKDRESRWLDGQRVANVVAYEKAGDDAFEAYDRSLALVFTQELRAQGGAEIARMAL